MLAKYATARNMYDLATAMALAWAGLFRFGELAEGTLDATRHATNWQQPWPWHATWHGGNIRHVRTAFGKLPTRPSPLWTEQSWPIRDSR